MRKKVRGLRKIEQAMLKQHAAETPKSVVEIATKQKALADVSA
jgi:hypothetical protein